MKFDPRAVGLIGLWNGSADHPFPEVLNAYRTGMRLIGNHDAVIVLMRAWLRTTTPFPGILRFYRDSVLAVDEMDQLGDLLEDIPAEPEPQEPKRIVVAPPIPVVLKSKDPVRRLETSYLDGTNRR